jgi:two-component system LytT family sensor kinase
MNLTPSTVTGVTVRLIPVLIHVLVWSLLIYVLFNYPPLVSNQVKIPRQFLTKQICHMVLMIGTYYFNTYYLVPKVLLKGKKAAFVLALISIMIFAGLIMARVEIWFSLAEHLRRAMGKKIWHNAYVDFFGLFTTMLVLGISTSLAIVQQWNRDWKVRQELETKTAVAELTFLKAQINPHFFFNTLNSIYALTYINAASAREVILKLSGMMRYLLYETPHNSTTLAKELAFIQNYVEIMKLRLNDNMVVELLLPHYLSDIPIAPMLLLPFVENAFKHGVDDNLDGSIAIMIAVEDNQLNLVVKNTITACAHHTDVDEKGIGLVNTQRRLELLYPERHSLTINHQQNDREYLVNLTINL